MLEFVIYFSYVMEQFLDKQYIHLPSTSVKLATGEVARILYSKVKKKEAC